MTKGYLAVNVRHVRSPDKDGENVCTTMLLPIYYMDLTPLPASKGCIPIWDAVGEIHMVDPFYVRTPSDTAKTFLEERRN